MEQAILFGNGFNRLVKTNPSWDGLLKSISGNFTLPDLGLLPPTQIYEFHHLKHHQNRHSEFELKQGIASKLNEIKRCDLYDSLLESGVKIFITPNYDYMFLRIWIQPV